MLNRDLMTFKRQFLPLYTILATILLPSIHKDLFSQTEPTRFPLTKTMSGAMPCPMGQVILLSTIKGAGFLLK